MFPCAKSLVEVGYVEVAISKFVEFLMMGSLRPFHMAVELGIALVSREAVEAMLTQWENSVREQRPVPFQTLFPMLRLCREEILNYFHYPYANGFLEGKNNRIKVIKRMAYGYRNPANFRQRILLSNRQQVRQVRPIAA